MIKDDSIFIKNIYYMLAYAYRSLRMDEMVSIEAEKFDNTHDLFAALLTKDIGRLVKRGLHRNYVLHNEELATLRGKVDIGSTVKTRLARRHTLVCEYDEFSDNILLNQILKTTIVTLLRLGDIQPVNRVALKKLALFFGDVDELDPRNIPWSSLRFTRHNNSYRIAIGLSRLLFDGMLLTTEAGDNKLRAFLDDQRMSQLFERFVYEYYAQEYMSLTVSAPQIKWAVDDGLNNLLPTMQSDIVLGRDSRIVIIDTKYYSRSMQEYFGARTIHSGNLYQIFTYVKNKQAELEQQSAKVSGILLYARTDEDVQPDVSYQMSGNRISVKTLDLNCEFASIAAQLDAIATEYFTL